MLFLLSPSLFPFRHATLEVRPVAPAVLKNAHAPTTSTRTHSQTLLRNTHQIRQIHAPKAPPQSRDSSSPPSSIRKTRRARSTRTVVSVGVRHTEYRRSRNRKCEQGSCVPMFHGNIKASRSFLFVAFVKFIVLSMSLLLSFLLLASPPVLIFLRS